LLLNSSSDRCVEGRKDSLKFKFICPINFGIKKTAIVAKNTFLLCNRRYGKYSHHNLIFVSKARTLLLESDTLNSTFWFNDFLSKTFLPTGIWPTQCFVELCKFNVVNLSESLLLNCVSWPNVCRPNGYRPKGVAFSSLSC
jgi:hypothetical protein